MPDLVFGTTPSSCLLETAIGGAWEICLECGQALGDALMRQKAHMLSVVLADLQKKHFSKVALW